MRAVPLTVNSIIDAVETSLRDQILDQVIPMGVAVKETEVARIFEVGRPTAKAAIERLVAEGLLQRDIHKSAYVSVLTSNDVSDLYFTRTVIESEVVRRLSLEKEVPDDAWRSLEELQSLSSGSAPRAYVEPDIAFHTALLTALGSPRLQKIHRTVMRETQLCMAQVQVHNLLSPRDIVEEHRHIATAIANGDAATAVAELESHLSRASRALVGYLSGAH